MTEPVLGHEYSICHLSSSLLQAPFSLSLFNPYLKKSCLYFSFVFLFFFLILLCLCLKVFLSLFICLSLSLYTVFRPLIYMYKYIYLYITRAYSGFYSGFYEISTDARKALPHILNTQVCTFYTQPFTKRRSIHFCHSKTNKKYISIQFIYISLIRQLVFLAYSSHYFQLSLSSFFWVQAVRLSGGITPPSP